MWALGLIVGTLIGAVIAQGAGAFVGAIVGLAIGIVVGQQRKGVRSRVETLESQMLNLESRINALDKRAAVARDFAARFGAGLHGWPTGLDFIVFETHAYSTFWDGMTESQVAAV